MSGKGKPDKKDSRLVPVVIFGQTYKVRADEDVSRIEELARYVDTKMKTLSETTGTSEPLRVAVLAALNVADELFKLEEKLEGEGGGAQDVARLDELIRALDEALVEPTETSPAVS